MSRNLFRLDETRFTFIPAGAFWKIVPHCVLGTPECTIDLKYWDLHYHDGQYFTRHERELMSLKDPSRPSGIKRVPYIQHMINFELQAWKNLGDWYVARGACPEAERAYASIDRLQNSYTRFDYSTQLAICAKDL
jgi:hypothetical protein